MKYNTEQLKNKKYKTISHNIDYGYYTVIHDPDLEYTENDTHLNYQRQEHDYFEIEDGYVHEALLKPKEPNSYPKKLHREAGRRQAQDADLFIQLKLL